MGLRVDDEDDLAADAEELSGSNAAINLDANVQGLPHGPSAQLAGYEVIDGKECRTGAKCRHCKKDFTGKSTHGTGYSLRHNPICPVLKDCSAMAQIQLKFNPDGSVRTWEYSPDVART
jgi:hypothetical protein